MMPSHAHCADCDAGREFYSQAGAFAMPSWRRGVPPRRRYACRQSGTRRALRPRLRRDTGKSRCVDCMSPPSPCRRIGVAERAARSWLCVRYESAERQAHRRPARCRVARGAAAGGSGGSV